MATRKSLRKATDKDLPEVAGLKRTGREGELISEVGRKKELLQKSSALEQAKNNRAGMGRKIVTEMIPTSGFKKKLEEDIQSSNKDMREIQNRINELKTRTTE